MTEPNIRSIVVLVHGDREPMAVDVVVGYDSDDVDYEFDSRIFYYFEDEAEFDRAKTKGLEWFRVLDGGDK